MIKIHTIPTTGRKKRNLKKKKKKKSTSYKVWQHTYHFPVHILLVHSKFTPFILHLLMYGAVKYRTSGVIHYQQILRKQCNINPHLCKL